MPELQQQDDEKNKQEQASSSGARPSAAPAASTTFSTAVFHPGTGSTGNFPRASTSTLMQRRIVRASRTRTPVQRSAAASTKRARIEATIGNESRPKNDEATEFSSTNEEHVESHHESDCDDSDVVEDDDDDSDDQDYRDDFEEDDNDDQDEFAKDDDADSDDDASQQDQCCICFGEPTSRNPIAVLPCCGSSEATSTTRFCGNCIVKCLSSQGSDDCFPLTVEGHLVGECPRCRSLIAVKKAYGSLLDIILPKPPIIERASFRLAVKHAGRKDNVKPILYTASYVYPKFMPVELLEDNVEKLQQLCRWGILEQIREGEIYAIDPAKQVVLRDIIESPIGDHHDGDPPALVLVSGTLLQAACVALFRYKVGAAVRMFNQCIAMFLVGIGALPDGLHKAWQGWIVACLNVLLVIMIVQVIFLLIGYAFFAFVTIKTVGWLISTNANSGWMPLLRRIVYVLVAVFASLGFCRGETFEYASIGFRLATSATWLFLCNTLPEWLSSICKYCGPILLILMAHRYVGNRNIADEQ